jgi:CBS domain-containing protein
MGRVVLSCEQLRQEHDFIGEVLSGLDVLIRVGQAGAAIPPLAVSGAVEFFSVFVESCHERKEEEGLFPLLDTRGFPDRDAVTTIRADHEEASRLLGTLRSSAGRQPVDGDVIAKLETYAVLLRRHIATEDTAILPFAERVMSSQDDVQLTRAFDRIEKRAFGPGGPGVVRALGDAVTHACRTTPSVPATGEALLRARDIMRPNPRAVAPGDTLSRAAEVMESLGTRELPVVARGVLVGILTRTDMEPHRGHFEWTIVRAVMTPDPVTVSPDASVHAVATLLLERGFNGVPVTMGGALLGMIARRDVLRVLAQPD